MQRKWHSPGGIPATDALLALALAVAALLSTMLDAAAAHPLAEIVALVVAASVVLRTRAPMTMAVIASLGIVVLALLPNPVTPLWAFATSLLIAFSLAARLSGAKMLVALALLLAAEYVIQIRTSASTVEMLITPLILVSAPALAGWLLAKSRAQAQRLRTLSAELEASQSRVAELSAEAERARIVRDLHDVLGHTLSSIAVQAGAAGSLLRADDPATASVQRIRRAAQEGLDEVRGLLSAQAAGVGHDIERVTDLVRTDGAALTVRGQVRPLPGNISSAAYRIVQEALTNARRHAPGTSVAVTEEYAIDRLIIEVLNRGPITTVHPAATSRGLVGIRERAIACGGCAQVGPTDDGAWRVHVEFPLPARVPSDSSEIS